MSSRTPILALALTAAAAAALFAFLTFTGGEDAGRGDIQVDPDAIAALPAPADEPRIVELVPPPRVAKQDALWNDPTRVLWPCQVELDLVQADYLPTQADVPPVGTGRTARLSGRIQGAGEAGVRAEVRFVEGPNQGRVLLCDGTGAFGATDLYPGLAIVEVRGPEIVGAKREVRLRQNSQTLLNVGFGMVAAVSGRVIDRRGEPVRGARVELDGRATTSGADGGFYFTGVAGGQCLVEVEHPDFASLFATYPVAAGREQQARDCVLTLDDPVSITISTPKPVGGPGPTLVYLQPNTQQRQVRGSLAPIQSVRFPWHTINPIEVPPNKPVVVENLPARVLKVVAFRAGAVAREQIVNPRGGRITPVTIRLQEAPRLTGLVRFNDKPLPGVAVSLQAPDQVRAIRTWSRQPSYALESEVMPYFPPARQDVLTDVEGRFQFTAWSDVADVRYLEARGPGGSWAGRLVSGEDSHVELDLASVELGDSRVVVEMPGRTQGLPLEVSVNGAPQDPYVLSPYAELVIESLVAGRWRLRMTWNGRPVLEEEFHLLGEEVLSAALPIGAVEGQDREAWRRAGRDWPF